jgi:hypothetical protein
VDARELEQYLAHASTPRWGGPPTAGSERSADHRRGWLYGTIGALSLLLVAAAALFFSPALREKVTAPW